MAGEVNGTSGEGSGTIGRRAGTSGVPAAGYVAAAIGTLLVTSMNVWSGLHGSPTDWRIAVYEYTSAVAILALLWPVGMLVQRLLAQWPTRKGLSFAVLVSGLLAFTVAHVSGFILLRTLVFEAFGQPYVFGGTYGWAFELPKEAAIYAIITVVFIVVSLNRLSRAPQSTPHPVFPTGAPRILLREGQRQYHVSITEIAAISSAGNYVEYHLIDGRRPLVRGTLSVCNKELAGLGFARSHRSWLINTNLITEVQPVGSGDRRLLLLGGTEAPLSRRLIESFEAELAVAQQRLLPPYPALSNCGNPADVYATARKSRTKVRGGFH